MRTLEVVAVQAIRSIGGIPLAGEPATAPYESVTRLLLPGHTLAMGAYINGQFRVQDVEDSDRYAALQAAFQNEDPGYQIHWVSWWSIPKESECWMPPRPLRLIGED